ncbi:hypothetical protein AMTR_s00331p00011860 [Amborella trichopoda]|uniref:Fructose-bisphosphate aldolase n=1 Tax=Amborella trichopoda TaxID=13333 RepID=W1P788_AMBTC|nr:hypothetical protein AMTR_s00331p00011860 [Amborella trichopoda]
MAPKASKKATENLYSTEKAAAQKSTQAREGWPNICRDDSVTKGFREGDHHIHPSALKHGGTEVVVAAAEAERSPAILQIHTGALKHGGPALVAACISAVEQVNVPITVHFDHEKC